MEDKQQAHVDELESTTSPAVTALVDEARRALSAVEPRAFLVLPRVLRRVVKAECELPALTIQVPHRKSWIIDRSSLLRHVELDELGLEPHDEPPPKAILIARPDDRHIESLSQNQLRMLIWRLLFHARIDLEYLLRQQSGDLDEAAFRQRIDELGQVEFDEIRTVLRREHFVPPDAPASQVFIEFAALFCELKHFLPHCLGSYFPSFEDPSIVEELLERDISITELLESTRLDGLVHLPEFPDDSTGDETDEELDSLTGHAHLSRITAVESDSERESGFPPLLPVVLAALERNRKPSLRAYGRMIRRADKAFVHGNAVGAALYQIRAATLAPQELVNESVNGALGDIERLVRRLQAALDFDDSAARDWYESLVGLLIHSPRGFWNADKRLLYDLQKVCVDHERDIYTVDLIGCVASFGHRPIKRALPNQREVLMSKHLRSATRRLVTSRLTGPERRRLSLLLHAAAHSAEHQMRTRLRPLTTETLERIDIVPADVPERVAFRKLVEELLDVVAHHGFLTMGDLRDAISRSNLKLADLSGPQEFILGDRLLKADRELSRSLDGVYQRGDVYLRLLQRLSAAGFGTNVGRFLTRYVAIPYGGAFICLEAFMHVAEKFASLGPGIEKVTSHTADLLNVGLPVTDPVTTTLLRAASHESLSGHLHDPFHVWRVTFTPWMTAALGTFILLLIHVIPFRRAVANSFKYLFSVLRRFLYEWPVRFFRLQSIRRLMRSRPVLLFRKFILWPAIPTSLVCGVLPQLYESMPAQTPLNWGVVLCAMSVILNSRVGRDVEELTTEWVHSTWTRIRVHVFVALFDLIMESFKKLLEAFDRVLYAVDEWLRFKSGETSLSLALKAVLGVFWKGFTFVARFCVNLLIEPQINPIKHFPVVTVSHKLLIPLAPTFIELLTPVAGGADIATAIVGPFIFLVPGVFGFMAWELSSNWQLYRANRGTNLKPVLVGTHGETFIRLMKPGFHSGTLPKLFGRLRRVDRKRSGSEHSLARSKYLDQLHHVHVAVNHFVERELIGLLEESPMWNGARIRVGRLRLASNNIRVELLCSEVDDEPLELVFEEQSGWLVASTFQAGWVRSLSTQQQQVLLTAIIGFYRLAGVDLVREQIAATFAPRTIPYDVDEEGLLVWPDGQFEAEAVYSLRHHTTVRPYPRSVVRAYQLPQLPTERLIFSETSLPWDVWSQQWDDDQDSRRSDVLAEDVKWNWHLSAAAPHHNT
ncbi:MAG: hypothetical protein ACYTGL_07540 [Planctomycetota bacterium]|jgi:hypothetical protein